MPFLDSAARTGAQGRTRIPRDSSSYYDDRIIAVWRQCRDGCITEQEAERRDLSLRIKRGDRIGRYRAGCRR